MLIEAVAVPFERVARIGSAPVTPRIEPCRTISTWSTPMERGRGSGVDVLPFAEGRVAKGKKPCCT